MFDEIKTTQAAARFLRTAGGTMNYKALIDVLYLADRGALLKWGRPITGDEYFVMKLGPVLSHVHDLLTEMQPPDEYHPWTACISREDSDAVLMEHPGSAELSEAEESHLDEVFERFKYFLNDSPGFLTWIYDNLPEVPQVDSGRIALGIGEILRTEGRSDIEIENVLDELLMLERVDSMSSKY